MDWRLSAASSRVLLASVVVMAVVLSSLQQPAASSWDDLAPLFPPLFNACQGVDCGKGSCRQSANQTLPFICECDSGWKQIHGGHLLAFLPCVVPNCSFDLSCTNATSPAPSAPQSPNNQSIFNPCNWAYCGRGSCTNTAAFQHICECNQGSSNLFNITFFPCFSDCALEGECKNLGIGSSNRSSSASTPGRSDQNGSPLNHGSSRIIGTLSWSIICMVCIAMVLQI